MNFNPFHGFADRARAHPFQTGLGALAGIFGGPLAGQAARMGFNAINNHGFNSALTNNNAAMADRGNAAGQQAMDRPLNGALGGMPEGRGNDALASALMGNSGQGHGGNQTGWNMSQNYANSQPSGGLLDFLGPSQNTTPNGSFFTNPQYAPGKMDRQDRQDRRDSNGGGMQFGTGVSNFMVGGNPVINGVRPMWDPNGGVVYGRKFGY